MERSGGHCAPRRGARYGLRGGVAVGVAQTIPQPGVAVVTPAEHGAASSDAAYMVPSLADRCIRPAVRNELRRKPWRERSIPELSASILAPAIERAGRRNCARVGEPERELRELHATRAHLRWRRLCKADRAITEQAVTSGTPAHDVLTRRESAGRVRRDEELCVGQSRGDSDGCRAIDEGSISDLAETIGAPAIGLAATRESAHVVSSPCCKRREGRRACHRCGNRAVGIGSVANLSVIVVAPAVRGAG